MKILKAHLLYPTLSMDRLHSLPALPLEKVTNMLVLAVMHYYRGCEVQPIDILKKLYGPSSPLNAKKLKYYMDQLKIKQHKYTRNRKLYFDQHKQLMSRPFWLDKNSASSLCLATSTSTTTFRSTTSKTIRFSKSTQTMVDPLVKYLKRIRVKQRRKIKNLRDELKATNKKLSHCLVMRSKQLEHKRTRCQKINQLRAANKLSERKIMKLEEKLKTAESTPIPPPVDVKLYDHRKRTYVPKCEQCVLTLRNLGISDAKVCRVMAACLDMANVSYDRLPQETYVSKTRKRLNGLSSIKLAETSSCNALSDTQPVETGSHSLPNIQATET